MQRRLVGQISNWLRLSKGAPPTPSANIPFVNHFNFNPGKPLEESFRLPINFIQTVPGQTELQVPGFIPVEAIKAPADTLQVELCISAVALRLNNYSSFGNESISITIPYNSTAQPAQNIPLALQTDSGNMLVTAILIRFTVEIKSRVTNTRADKLPAAIVGTFICNAYPIWRKYDLTSQSHAPYLPNKMVTFAQQENNEIKMQLFLKN